MRRSRGNGKPLYDDGYYHQIWVDDTHTILALLRSALHFTNIAHHSGIEIVSFHIDRWFGRYQWIEASSEPFTLAEWESWKALELAPFFEYIDGRWIYSPENVDFDPKRDYK